MPKNPSLPPSLGSVFREYEERLDALERGDRTLSYRQPLTTNDASNARELHMTQLGPGNWEARDHEIYAAALVNPKYPVLVARFHVVTYAGQIIETWLRSSMRGTSRLTQRWRVNGPASGFRTVTFELAWLHGMEVNQWADTVDQSVVKRGNVELWVRVVNQAPNPFRNEDFSVDALSKGFTAAQTEFMQAWFPTTAARVPVFAREPEYVFLAPLSAFPTASPEGSLITGANVPGYSVVTATAASTSEPSAVGLHGEGPVWSDEPGEWPVTGREADE